MNKIPDILKNSNKTWLLLACFLLSWCNLENNSSCDDNTLYIAVFNAIYSNIESNDTYNSLDKPKFFLWKYSWDVHYIVAEKWGNHWEFDNLSNQKYLDSVLSILWHTGCEFYSNEYPFFHSKNFIQYSIRQK